MFNPGVTTPAVTFTLTSADSITAHFTGSTLLPEVPETNPSITAMPSVFNDQTTIELYLPSKAAVAMNLYSVDGRKVMTLEENSGLTSGLHKFDLNLASSSCSNGIYFLELVSGNHRQTIKLVYNP